MLFCLVVSKCVSYERRGRECGECTAAGGRLQLQRLFHILVQSALEMLSWNGQGLQVQCLLLLSGFDRKCNIVKYSESHPFQNVLKYVDWLPSYANVQTDGQTDMAT